MEAGGPGSGPHKVIEKYHGAPFGKEKIFESKEKAHAYKKRKEDQYGWKTGHTFHVKKVK